MPLQWRNQIWQSLEESAGKRCSECALDRHPVIGLGDFPSLFLLSNIFFSSHNSRKGRKAGVRGRRGVCGRSGRGIVPPTLRASLSGTFLQTLPDLVTPLKGHSTLRAPLSGTLLQIRQWPSERRPTRVKKSSVSIQTIVVLFVLV